MQKYLLKKLHRGANKLITSETKLPHRQMKSFSSREAHHHTKSKNPADINLSETKALVFC